MGTVITDMDLDVLKYIMIFVATSGAENLARAVAVCRKFMELAEDVDVLKAANFDDVRLSGRYELFQQINGLLNRSARAGNSTAKYMLAKIILVSSSQLLEMVCKTAHPESSSNDRVSVDQACGSDDPQVDTLEVSKQNFLASSFMAQFAEDQPYNRKVPTKSLTHFELVRLFLLQCSPNDLAEMRLHLQCYFKFYNGSSSDEGDLIFFNAIDKLCLSGKYLRAYEELENLIDTLDTTLDTEVKVRRKLKEFKEEMGREFYLHVKLFYELGTFLVKHKNQIMEGITGFEAALFTVVEDFKIYGSKLIAAMFENKRASMISIFDNTFM